MSACLGSVGAFADLEDEAQMLLCGALGVWNEAAPRPLAPGCGVLGEASWEPGSWCRGALFPILGSPGALSTAAVREGLGVTPNLGWPWWQGSTQCSGGECGSPGRVRTSRVACAHGGRVCEWPWPPPGPAITGSQVHTHSTALGPLLQVWEEGAAGEQLPGTGGLPAGLPLPQPAPAGSLTSSLPWVFCHLQGSPGSGLLLGSCCGLPLGLHREGTQTE